MPFTLNTVMIAGNLTRNPELRVVGAEKTVANFSLAINRRFKGPDGELKEETTYVDCEAWGRTAELVGQYLVKGSGCYVEGRLRLDNWTDKEGKNRSRLKVVTDQVQFLGRPRGEGGEGGGGEAGGDAGVADGDGGDSRSAPRSFNGGARPANPAMGRREPNPVRQVRSPAGMGSAALGDDQPPF
jgi:single-strand DNA-binding protein